MSRKGVYHRFITVLHFGTKNKAIHPDIHAIERKWRHIYSSSPTNTTSPSTQSTLLPKDTNVDKVSKYILAMFPYPSGHLHMGHARVYTAADVLARYHRLLQTSTSTNSNGVGGKGGRVLFPIGWDAFGLPAENAAINASQGSNSIHSNSGSSSAIHPSEWTSNNIAQMRQQFRDLNYSFTDDQLCTCHPNYYHQTQSIFRMLYKRNLVYQQSATVNWDPVDRTVLADEQVDSRGKSWRSGVTVVRRELVQWYVRITEMGGELANMDGLQGWPEAVKAMQVQWIGARSGRVRVIDGQSVFLVRGRREATNDKVLADSLKIEYDSEIQPVQLDNRPIPVLQTTETFEPNQTLYRMRDWLVSRQRYWGSPIPVVHCPTCKLHQVVDHVDLPHCSVQEWSSFRADQSSSSTLLKDWHTSGPSCPKCHGPTLRERDTLDTFFDSSWYYLRFLDPHNTTTPVSIDKIQSVDIYLGGIEHAILHLLYARFMGKVLSGNGQFEPFQRLVSQGLVMARTYRDAKTDRYIAPPDASQHLMEDDGGSGSVEVTWQKMSKSKLNGVNPSELISKYGSDALRVAILFKAPLEVHMHWEEGDITGAQRWIQRLLNLSSRHEGNVRKDERVEEAVNRAIRSINRDLEACSFNTCIAHLMTLTGTLEALEPDAESMCKLASMLYPFAPFTAAEIYDNASVSEGRDVRLASWPEGGITGRVQSLWCRGMVKKWEPSKLTPVMSTGRT